MTIKTTLVALAGSLMLTAAAAPASNAHAGEARDLTPSYGHAETAGKPAITVRSQQGRKVEDGETVRFDIAVNRTGYAHLYVISASGRVQLWMENVPIKAGERMSYPLDDEFEIRATSPRGKDRVVAVLTKKRLDGFEGYDTTTAPQDLDLTAKAFRHAIDRKLQKLPNGQWTGDKAIVEVVN
jgi:hypothetical protein